MTENQQPYPPLLGQHINTVLLVILDRILSALHQSGFTDLRPAHLSIFRNLVPHGLHISELAERAGITKASVIYLVDDLQEHGYVQRLPDPSDGRATIVQFSERGWATYEVATTAVRSLEEEWARAVGREEMEAFLAILARLASLSSESEKAAQIPKPRSARLRGRRHTGL
ncbi:MarR family transcriptional regulator [Ktedonosporobacter rubrisoli]|uniref:MarR family transcriptional regulator n=1 Tax=Ktedonosporobacter rubrisoli TaxID=2509675 RepID=A0A4P6K303_KTERU|nr:MarR family transcriptional regulator [Ktedonosporobacter rubrisoli]QBD82618.1 MarR family transcriptional regulator [Ktedonosporobacter rubrisoli]